MTIHSSNDLGQPYDSLAINQTAVLHGVLLPDDIQTLSANSLKFSREATRTTLDERQTVTYLRPQVSSFSLRDNL